MKVGRYDYEGQIEDWPALMADVERVLRRGAYVLGPEVADFEAALAKYLGVPRVLGTNSGTDALVLAFRAAGIGAGSRVVTQANTFHATVASILIAGAEPVLVDSDPDSFTLDVDALTALDGADLAAVVPVHLYGRPCAMTEIVQYAERNELVVIEDAAQAIGARYRGRHAGSLGDFGCFSFHPSKNLAAAGDGGAITFASDREVELVEALRSLGQVGQNDHRYVGCNSKLDTLQALFLRAKLDRLDAWNVDRRRIAMEYTERLSGLPVQLQSAPPELEHVYHLFQVRVNQRDELLAALKSDGVDAVVRYPVPIHLQPAFDDQGWRAGEFPVAEALANELIALPVRPGMPTSEIDFVCERVHAFHGSSVG